MESLVYTVLFCGHQSKDWFEHDERLLPVVDSFIGQKVKASEKRSTAINAWIAVATTIVGAILGWLVSGLLPQVHLFPGH